MLRSVVDVGKLIEEVKKRPLLYDGTQNTWVYNKKRNAAWEEIAEEIFREIWDPSDQPKKEAFIRELQTKWKSIRDAYHRFCKQTREDRLTGKQRKPYVYSELLTFLDKTDDSNTNWNAIFLEDTSGNADDDIDDNDDSMDYFNDNSNPLQTAGDELSDSVSAATSTTAATTTTATATTTTTSTTASTSAKPTTVLVGRNMEKIGECLEQIVAIQKEDRNDDKMGNKKFLLSLLPFMERLPDDVNLEVRLQLMSVIQTYSNGESFMKM